MEGGFMFQPVLMKLYYSDPELYAQEYVRRFEEENSIHIDIKIGEHTAFVFPDYHMYEKIIEIRKVDTKIQLLCAELPGIAISHFRERCLIGEILQSNKIEGVISTRKELSEILQEVKTKRKPRNLRGIVSQYVMLIKNTAIKISSCEDIRELYDQLFSYDIGKNDKEDLPDGKIFRKGPVSVYSETQKEIHKGLFPESSIISAMDQAITFLRTEKADALIKIAVFHYLFGYIHPFYDGNGRTSRFISSSLLINELNSLIGFRISYTIKENLSKYYKAFKICNDSKNKGDISPFVHFFLDIILSAESNLLSSLKERQEKLIYFSKMIDNLPNSEKTNMRELYNLLIQASLFSNHGISMSELKTYMKESDATVRKRLSNIPKDLLLKQTVDRSNFYELNLEQTESHAVSSAP